MPDTPQDPAAPMVRHSLEDRVHETCRQALGDRMDPDIADTLAGVMCEIVEVELEAQRAAAGEPSELVARVRELDWNGPMPALLTALSTLAPALADECERLAGEIDGDACVIDVYEHRIQVMVDETEGLKRERDTALARVDVLNEKYDDFHREFRDILARGLGKPKSEWANIGWAVLMDELRAQTAKVRELEAQLTPRPMSEAPMDVDIHAMVRVRVDAKGFGVRASGYQGWLPLPDQRGVGVSGG